MRKIVMNETLYHQISREATTTTSEYTYNIRAYARSRARESFIFAYTAYTASQPTDIQIHKWCRMRCRWCRMTSQQRHAYYHKAACWQTLQGLEQFAPTPGAFTKQAP